MLVSFLPISHRKFSQFINPVTLRSRVTMSNTVGGKFVPKFRDVFLLKNKDPLRWFPGHMGKGLKQMQQTLKSVDCVIEVHDARIPISGRYLDFKHTITGLKPHIFVLNKIDLMDKSYKHPTTKLLQKEGIDNIFFTNFKRDTCKETKSIMPKAIELILKSNRYNRTTAEDYIMMIIGAPNVGKSSLINRLRNQHLRRKSVAQVGAKAGITRSLMEKIRISEDPSVFLLDTPGILDPLVRDVYAGLKLALCGCIQDTICGPEIMADYLLFWLNKHKQFQYADVLGMSEPTDNYLYLMTFIAAKLKIVLKLKDVATGQWIEKPDLPAAARHFVGLFRSGKLGKFCLDADIIEKPI